MGRYCQTVPICNPRTSTTIATLDPNNLLVAQPIEDILGLNLPKQQTHQLHSCHKHSTRTSVKPENEYQVVKHTTSPTTSSLNHTLICIELTSEE